MAVAPHMLALRELEGAGRVRIVGGHAPSAERRAAFAARWATPAFDHGPHRALIAEVLDAVEAGREPSNGARSALSAQRLTEAVLADSERRGA